MQKNWYLVNMADTFFLNHPQLKVTVARDQWLKLVLPAACRCQRQWAHLHPCRDLQINIVALAHRRQEIGVKKSQRIHVKIYVK